LLYPPFVLVKTILNKPTFEDSFNAKNAGAWPWMADSGQAVYTSKFFKQAIK